MQSTNTVQGNDIVNSANTMTGVVYREQNDLVKYFGLRRMNDSLLAENARLQQLISEYRSLDTLIDTFVHIAETPNDTSVHVVHFSDYLYRTARVINNSTTAPDNYITINRGSKNGIRKDMAVLSGTGIVGRVEHVSANFASILSALSTKQKVSARLKSGVNGSVIWDARNPHILTMTEVPQQTIVKKGDSVFTSDYSLYYPPDVLIGTVVKTEHIKKNAMQKITLWSSTNFSNLQYVYIVENKMTNEEKQLQNSSSKK